MDISTVKSNKGNDKLIVDGYDYHLDAKNKAVFRWACAKKKSKNCRGRIVTVLLNGKHLVRKGPSSHNHDPLAFEKEIFRANESVKDFAKRSELPPSQIIRNSVVQCGPAARVYLPKNKAQKQKITRVRSEVLKEPNCLDEINIPASLRYIEGELFVLCEKSFEYNEKIIILGTCSSLKLLSEAECWFMDGTFDVVPSIMRQLFTIHGKIDSETIPLVFCLMSSKTKTAYYEFFYEICRLACEYNVHLNPKRIISDFEKTIPLTAKQFFPSAIYKGCLFHFGQIIWRRVQKERLSSKYGNDEIFSLQIRMLKSLAFVPAEEVSSYYEELCSSFRDAHVKKIGKWFEQNYISGKKLKSTKSSNPQYFPEFWSVADAMSTNLPRTQNNVEAWHRRLKAVVGKRHVGVYRIISDLSKEYIVVKTRISQLRAGYVARKHKKRIAKNKQIKTIILKRNSMTKINFLKNIAYNIALS